MRLQETLETVNKAVWGPPLVILILIVGIYISVTCGFVQLRLFPKAMAAFLRQFKGGGNTSSYRALCTALAATVGTGNLAGVAGAIAIGGPGAVFWMWVCAFFGMATKFAEATLAVRFRNKSGDGYIGGPMYMIYNGLHKRWYILAYIYCFFGVIASFGVGNAAQINTVLSGVEEIATANGWRLSMGFKAVLGAILAVLLSVMLLGGAKRIGRLTAFLVPVASAGYLTLGITVLLLRVDMISGALKSIVLGAFTPAAATGGAVGSMLLTLRIGTSRGVFTNEAGMGTASIAHASGEVSSPDEQGLMGIVEVFLDTIVICTITALVILCSGVEIHYGADTGVALTIEAFSAICGSWVCIPLTIALCAFAIATIMGWGLYGARCVQFLLGDGAWNKFVLLQGVVAVMGACMHTGTVWVISDIVNGLMAIPNLLALFLLMPELRKIIRA